MRAREEWGVGHDNKVFAAFGDPSRATPEATPERRLLVAAVPFLLLARSLYSTKSSNGIEPQTRGSTGNAISQGLLVGCGSAAGLVVAHQD